MCIAGWAQTSDRSTILPSCWSQRLVVLRALFCSLARVECGHQWSWLSHLPSCHFQVWAAVTVPCPLARVGKGWWSQHISSPRLKQTWHPPSPWLGLVNSSILRILLLPAFSWITCTNKGLSCCILNPVSTQSQETFPLSFWNKRISPVHALSSCLAKAKRHAQSTQRTRLFTWHWWPVMLVFLSFTGLKQTGHDAQTLPRQQIKI